jgi:glucose/arabinose dehydrogenase
MSILSRLVSWHSERRSKGANRGKRRQRPPSRPRVEQLEDRVVPATVLDPNLDVRPVFTGLTTPTTMAFLGDNDFFVLERNTGRVQHIVNGALAGTVLDLPVNFQSERGLLGIALSPNFQEDGHVFLYWTESSTGLDTNVNANVPLLGNRVDRFFWDGSTLTFDQNIVRLRAAQPPNPPVEPGQFGNHDGGVIRFGPDGKLYIIIGDTGRRSWTQNLGGGPLPGQPDDQFGGPEADDAHLTGVVLRLNPDGSTPDDNPFRDIQNVFVATINAAQEVPTNDSTATGFAGFFLTDTALTIQATVVGIDFGRVNPDGTVSPTPTDRQQTANTDDDLIATHIHAPGAPGVNAGVVFGWIGTPFNDIAPNDVVVTPFTDGRVGGTVNAKWDLTEGNNTTLTAQLNNIRTGQSYINFHTVEFPGGEIRGQIVQDFDALANIHKTYAYGIRNSFGLAFDPFTGVLWESENSDDAFEEINRILPGHNGGWIQIMGPLDDEHIFQFKFIETTMFGGNTQQTRYPPVRIADTAEEALGRLLNLPGSHYADPEFSWRFAVPAGNLGFLSSDALGQDPLGRDYIGSLFTGGATASTNGGHLFRFRLNEDRTAFVFDSPLLQDKVDDNFAKNVPAETTQEAGFLFGTDFGIVTDIQTGPNGNLYIVSISQGTVFEIFRNDTGDTGGTDSSASPELSVAAQAQELELRIADDGNLWQNWGGQDEIWVLDGQDNWYFLMSNGELYRWDESDQAAGTLVGSLGTDYYTQPDLLF